MSTNHKLFVTATVLSIVTVGAVGAVKYARKSKSQLTAKHWIRLLSGGN